MIPPGFFVHFLPLWVRLDVKVVGSSDLRVHPFPVDRNSELWLGVRGDLMLVTVGVPDQPDSHVVHVHVGLEHLTKVRLTGHRVRLRGLRAVQEVAVVDLERRFLWNRLS